MLDIKFIKENLDSVEKNNASRNVKIDLKKLVDLDEQRKTLQSETESLRNERKKISKTKLEYIRLTFNKVLTEIFSFSTQLMGLLKQNSPIILLLN